MAYEVGFVDNAGTEGLAHWQMLAKIKAFAEANGWTTMRYIAPTDGTMRELILRGTGLSGDKEIYIGFRTYHSVANDYYNLSVAGFTGFVPSNGFTAQPGYIEYGVPAHNQRIDYWLTVNAQRIAFGLKVGTPVYEHGYAGFFFPYGTPAQYPYPLVVSGMLNGIPGTRFSDMNHTMGLKGARDFDSNRGMMSIRFTDGAWRKTYVAPWANEINFRDTGGRYKPEKAVLYTGGNVYGELDGILHITGFNNVVENTFVMGGKNYVVMQDVARTGFNDYYALELS